MINTVCGIGSTGRICTDIAEVLTKQGHECKIAYGRGEVPEKYQKYAIRIGGKIGVNLHAIYARLFDSCGFHSKRATRKLIKWIEEYDPEVIHLHNLHGYYIHIEELFNYLKQCQKKIIWTLHDCWSFTGHCSHFDWIGCDKWKNCCYKCPQKKRYPSSIWRDRSFINYRKKKELFTGINNMTIVTPSEWLANLVKKSFLNCYEIIVVNNGIDLETFKPTDSCFRQLYHCEGKYLILGVARIWNERKGFFDFIELSQKIDDNYRIVLVGVTKKQIKKLPPKIIGIKGTNSKQELAEIYTASNVFFNPTYEDNYPTTNLEAQACGVPVITYETGGSIESVPEPNIVSKGDLLKVEQLLRNRGFSICLETNKFHRGRMSEIYLSKYKDK